MRLVRVLLVLAACSPDVSTISQGSVVGSRPRPVVVTDTREAIVGLAERPLSPASTVGLESTDTGRQALSLLVACALRSSQTFQAGAEYFGETGLAPAWPARALGDDERAWVSACVMTHLTANGLAVPVSLRGRHRALAADPDERDAFSVEEGAFFGDLFATPLTWFACQGTGTSPAIMDRGCTLADPSRPGLTLCGMTLVGSCATQCRAGGRGFHRCRGGGAEHHEVITTFVAD